MRYPHLFSRLYNTPLMLHPDKAAVIESVFRAYAVSSASQGAPVPAIEMAAAPASPRDRKPYAVSDGGIALIPVMGTLVQRASGLDAMSGLTSYSRVNGMLDTAMADPDVRGVMLEIDSPGGEVSGLYDLVDNIYAQRDNKPIWGIGNEQAYSAAYAIGSSVSTLYLPRTAGVGSIGVIAMHVDQSKRDAAQGYSYTAIYAGAKKADFNSHAPLSDSAAADLQSEIDRLYDIFVESVARNRGISAESVRATEAGILNPQQALDQGFVDHVGTLSEAIAAMESAVKPKTIFSTTAYNAAPRKETRVSQNENAAAGDTAAIQAAAIAQARSEGVTAGAHSERERIGAILTSDEAKGREPMAQTFALETDMDAATAKKLLAKSPAAAAAGAGSNAFADAMAGVKNPKVGAGGGSEADESPEAQAATLAQKILNAGKPAKAQ